MRIFCIGRNYVAHAKELNNKVPKQPLVFMKPESALNKNGQIPYPSFSQDFHYELEMVLFISKAGKNISLDNAGDHFDHIGLGVDYTARDVQSKCKEKGHSWEIAKAFDNSAYLSEPFDKNNYDLSSTKFHLELNGQTVQSGDTTQMIFNFNYLIAHISKYFRIQEGDVVMTGTPAGVGPVAVNDNLKGYLEGELLIENLIISK